MKKQKLLLVKTNIKAGDFGDWLDKAKAKAENLWSAAKEQAAKANQSYFNA